MAAYEALDSGSEGPYIPEDTFALRLKVVRMSLGLTQSEAAERCELDDGSWSNWERGKKPRGMDAVVESICRGLGVDRDWLMWGGPLRTGSFSSPLLALPEPMGQGQLLADDLEPLDFYSRPALASV